MGEYEEQEALPTAGCKLVFDRKCEADADASLLLNSDWPGLMSQPCRCIGTAGVQQGLQGLEPRVEFNVREEKRKRKRS